MRYEIDIAGVMVPGLLLWLVAAFLLGMLLRRGFERLGLYRLVWHRALFDLAIFVVLLGGIVSLTFELLP